MCMNVDLPDPDGPVTARNSPVLHVQVHAAQRPDLDLADDVGLDEVLDRDDERHVLATSTTAAAESAGPPRAVGSSGLPAPRAPRRPHVAEPVTPVTTSVPGCSSPLDELGVRAVGDAEPHVHRLQLFVDDKARRAPAIDRGQRVRTARRSLSPTAPRRTWSTELRVCGLGRRASPPASWRRLGRSRLLELPLVSWPRSFMRAMNCFCWSGDMRLEAIEHARLTVAASPPPSPPR